MQNLKCSPTRNKTNHSKQIFYILQTIPKNPKTLQRNAKQKSNVNTERQQRSNAEMGENRAKNKKDMCSVTFDFDWNICPLYPVLFLYYMCLINTKPQ